MASLSRLISDLRPWAQKLVDVANNAGVGPRVTSTFRTLAQQQRLYSDFLAGKSKYPVAPPGTSAHEFGYAFDVVVDNDTDLKDLGKVWESWGGVWGGHYGDPVHFEFPGFKKPGSQTLAKTCGTAKSVIAQAVDLILGFAPGIGEVELIAWLVSLGFPRSRVLAFLSSPVTSTVCPSPR